MAVSGPQKPPQFTYIGSKPGEKPTGLSGFYDQSKFKVETVKDFSDPSQELSFQKAKAKFYRIIPLIPNKDGKLPDPILHVVFHAPSGSDQSDREKRDNAIEEVKRKIQEFFSRSENNHYNDLVFSIDANISAFRPRAGGRNDTISDYELNRLELTHLFNTLIPDDLMMQDCVTGEDVVLKTRAADMFTNQQLDKAEKQDPSNKAYTGHAKAWRNRGSQEERDRAREKGLQEVLSKLENDPPKAVLKFGTDETYGSDHSTTRRLDVNGIGFVTFPLIDTFGERGYHDLGEYFEPTALDDIQALRETLRAGTDKFLDIIINRLQVAGIDEANINGKRVLINEMTSAKPVHERAAFIKKTERAIVQDETILRGIIQEWAQSPEFKACNAALKKERQRFTTLEDIDKCVAKIHNKNYVITKFPPGKKLEDPRNEFINLQIGTSGKVAYRLTNDKGIVISGELDFPMRTGLSSQENAQQEARLRDAIITEARRLIEQVPAINLAEYSIGTMDETEARNAGLKLIHPHMGTTNREGLTHVSYTVVASDNVKYTGTIAFRFANPNNPSVPEYERLADEVRKDIATKIGPQATIINGKDLANQVAEFLGVQPFAGYPVDPAFDPRHKQMAHCVDLVDQLGDKSIDFITLTENSNDSDAQEACKDMNARRKAALAAQGVDFSDAVDQEEEPSEPEEGAEIEEEESSKPGFSKGAALGVGIIGGLIAGGIAAAIIGFVWPVAVVTIVSALVVGGISALYAQYKQEAAAESGEEEEAPPEEEVAPEASHPPRHAPKTSLSVGPAAKRPSTTASEESPVSPESTDKSSNKFR